MQIQQYRSVRRLVVVFTLIMSLALLGTISTCEKKKAPSVTSSSSNEDCNDEIDGPIESSPIANQPLALARYSILMKIQHKTGGDPLPGKTTFSRKDVLFPRGKSDKVYILLCGHESLKSWHETNDFILQCYKSKGKGVKLLYSVKLKKIPKPSKDNIRVRNIHDYLSLFGAVKEPGSNPYSYVLPKNINKDVKSDFSLRQELVDYSYDPYISVLYVHHFHPDVKESLWFKYKHMQSFVVPNDNSGAKLRWYKTYGFPVADCELTAKGGGKK